MGNRHTLPTVKKLDLDIDLDKLKAEVDALASNYIDVMSANPSLCENHVDLVKSVYDNFEQINLTVASEVMPFESSIKERLKRREEHMYNVPTPEYSGSYIESIVQQCKAPASRVRITKLAPGKIIPFHTDYDVSYGVRIIVPVYTSPNVINMFFRNGGVDSHRLEAGIAHFLNIGYPHGVVNMGEEPRIALMFTLDGVEDLGHI